MWTKQEFKSLARDLAFKAHWHVRSFSDDDFEEGSPSYDEIAKDALIAAANLIDEIARRNVRGGRHNAR